MRIYADSTGDGRLESVPTNVDAFLGIDEAGTDISAAPEAANDAPVAGTYRSAGPLGAFESQDASGKWTLFIADVSSGERQPDASAVEPQNQILTASA